MRATFYRSSRVSRVYVRGGAVMGIQKQADKLNERTSSQR